VGWMNAIHQEDIAMVKEEWKNFTAKDFNPEKRFSHIFRFCKPNGEANLVHSIAIALFEEFDAVPYGFLGIVQDISKAKTIEEAKLESLAKGKLLNQISREIRGPLDAILQSVDKLILNSIHSSQVEMIEMLKTIDLSGKHLATIAEEMAHFTSKPERFDETFILKNFLDDISKSYLPLCTKKGICYKLSLDPSIPAQIKTDPTKLRQILLNLLSNALKFTKSGSIHLSAMLEHPRQLKFKVADTGNGIDQVTKSCLFQPFQQAEDHHLQGSGLGLFISKQLAEVLQGALILDYSSDQGSCFSLSIQI
jgi:signal transduction histidine kinase